MVKLVNLKFPQNEIERFERIFVNGGSVLFNVMIERGGTKYPLLGYMTNDESIINVLKNGIKYIDYYLDEIQPIIGGYLPLLHYILCDGNANCICVDYILDNDLLEAILVSNKIGYLIGLKPIGHLVGEMQLVFDDAYEFHLEITEESRNKAKEILEKLKNVTDDDIYKALDFYVRLKLYGSCYRKFLRKILSTLNVDGINPVGEEPFTHANRYFLKITTPVTLKSG